MAPIRRNRLHKPTPGCVQRHEFRRSVGEVASRNTQTLASTARNDEALAPPLIR